uniref:Uncharacterized protein n=2 Tax=Ciona intestinalis TaxID=7719 RepID=H2XT21_CIOIN
MALLKNQEEIYFQLSSLLERTDIASSSFVLSSVAMKCDEKLLEEFMNDKPDVTDKNFRIFVQAHLYTASFWGFFDVAHALIQQGADVNHKNTSTLWTPLHAACFQEHEKLIVLLLESGANIYSLDKDGRSCVDIASVSNKVWSHFSDLGCKRTPDALLIKKGLLQNSVNVMKDNFQMDLHTKSGIKLIEYTPPQSSRFKKSVNSSTEMQAALGGDVLAGNDITPRQNTSSSRSVSKSSMSSLLQWK